MSKTIAFVHTAPANVATFSQLLAEIDPSIPAKHYLDESLLRDARANGGITPELAQRIHQAMNGAMNDETSVIVCTCSTIGAFAEETAPLQGQTVMRVDRPMAERAVALGSRIIVAAALESTIGPTSQLIQQVAEERGCKITIQALVCEGAWERFEADDQAGYFAKIAETLHNSQLEGDVIVLAQASMTGAALLCADLPMPILSSPRMGLEAALAAYRAAI